MICLPASTESVMTLGKSAVWRFSRTTGRCSASSTRSSSGRRLRPAQNLRPQSQAVRHGPSRIRTFLRIAEDEGVAGRPGLRLGTADKAEIAGIGDVGHQQGEHGRTAGLESRRHPVVPVAQSHRDGLHVVACRRADPVRVGRAREKVDTATSASSATSCRVTSRRFAAATPALLANSSSFAHEIHRLMSEHWQIMANIAKVCQYLPYLAGDGGESNAAARNEEPITRGRGWAVWAVGVLTYILTVMQRTSLGVAGLDAARRFGITPGVLAAFVFIQVTVYIAAQIRLACSSTGSARVPCSSSAGSS